jgi:hypothetical protein
LGNAKSTSLSGVWKMKPVTILKCANIRRAFSVFRADGETAAPPSSSVGAPFHIPGGAAVAPPSSASGGVDLSAARVALDAKIAKKRSEETPEVRITRVRTKLGSLRNDHDRATLKNILEGNLFAKPGERDEVMFRVTGVVTTAACELSEDEILTILRPSLKAMNQQAQEQGLSPATDEWALDKIERSLETAREKQALKDAQDDGLKAVLMRASGEVPSTTEEESSGPYTPEQIKEFADSQNCSEADFVKRWVIQHGESFYVFCRGAYLRPITRGALRVSIPRDLALVASDGPAAIQWTKMNEDFTREIPKKIPDDILDDHATVARDVIASLTLRYSHYDPVAQTFLEAGCPIRDIKPKYNANIDKWFRILGGDQADKLLDWVASFQDLTRQTCAIYFSGPPSTGKSTFANGMARLWIKHGSPTELRRILENFNGDLLRCPLIFADEYVPQGKNVTAEIRQIIGSDSRTLSRKNIPNAMLQGCLRLILAGNNDHILAADEELTNDDLEAVGKRFLHIKTTQAAADFLQQLNGLSRKEGWVTDDGIAAHAMWLKENRKVVEGDRFLVEGHKTSFHLSMPTQSKIGGSVTEWLIKFLNATDDVRKNINQKPDCYALAGNGEFLINAQAVKDNWDIFLGATNTPPSLSSVGKALRNLSTGEEKRIDNVRFHKVNLDAIYSWADRLLVGSPEKMKQLIDHVITEQESKRVLKIPFLKIVAAEEKIVDPSQKHN